MGENVILFTSSRAELGLQLPVMRALKNMGCCVNVMIYDQLMENIKDKLIQEKVTDQIIEIESQRSKDGSVDYQLRATSHVITKSSEIFLENSYDYGIVYADRFESFAFAVSVAMHAIPMIHIEAGDLTQGGTIDDNLRFAITELAQLYITTNNEARDRLIKSGKDSRFIWNAGLTTKEQISRGEMANLNEIKNELGIDISNATLLCTYHALSLSDEETTNEAENFFDALERLAKMEYNIIITGTNIDKGSLIVNQCLEGFKEKLKDCKNVYYKSTLGCYIYYGLLSCYDRYKLPIICVGNSSSGVKETPFFNTPTIDYGRRQRGRTRGDNVEHVEANADSLIKTIKGMRVRMLREDMSLISNNPYKGDTTLENAIKQCLSMEIALVSRK